MMALLDELRKIAATIEQQKQWMRGEQATINVSIAPFIRALGYDTQNLAEVRPEYKADARTSGNEKVDFALMQHGRPIVFIEAKAARTDLNEHHWRQLHHYLNAEDVRFGILTNGIEYRFYTDLKKRNIMDKQAFMTIDMLSLDERLVVELEGFTRSSFAPERILSSARKMAVVRLLEEEYRQPTDELAEHFARKVYSGRVTNSAIKEFKAVLKQAWRQFVSQQIPENPRPVVIIDTGNGSQESETSDVDNDERRNILDKRAIPVFARWRGYKFEASLVFDTRNHRSSRVTFGSFVAAPSRAALEAIRTVEPGRKAENGWSFWKLRDPDGNQERVIGDLRTDTDLVRRLRTKG